jgi:hypothetical protein
MRSTRSRRSQPELTTGYVEMRISSGRRVAIASIVARNGSGSPTSPVASIDSLATSESARSTRACADSRTASS